MNRATAPTTLLDRQRAISRTREPGKTRRRRACCGAPDCRSDINDPGRIPVYEVIANIDEGGIGEEWHSRHESRIAIS
jgi:hypothetical protein